MARERKESRPRRIHRIAKALAHRYEKQRAIRRPLVRRETRPRRFQIIAYDLETTRISAGSPEPLYITAYGADFVLASRVTSYAHLAEIVCERMLTSENKGARFVAWNGNHFDAYFIARALLLRPEYELKPYFAKGNKLRGLMVTHRELKLSWEFLDGIAMTGCIMKLADFLKLFAPELEKLKGPDFDVEDFDPGNADHRRYAIRDSEGLYEAMMRAQSIVADTFGIPFSPTIGATGIRIFQRKMPEGVTVWAPSLECLEIVRNVAYRGGYCVAMRAYRGPVWKYDVNQAYAAAMREDDLPAGRAVWTTRRPRYAKVWLARVTARKRGNLIPFYYRDLDGHAAFGLEEIGDTWLTNVEIEQLEREGWRLSLSEFWVFDEHFRMRDFVNELEQLRSTCEGGPSGAVGTMIKAVGNHSYGKTVERLEAVEIRLAVESPEGYAPYDDVDGEIANVWARFVEPPLREYHQPQIGTWITASVRMKIRRAALLAPDAFLYADTDCVMFSRPVALPIDKRKYGLWKVEAAGERYIVVVKKVYAAEDGSIRHAKGLNLRHGEPVKGCRACEERGRACGLSIEDFERWRGGSPPVQEQLQRKNWLRFLSGEPMFTPLTKIGQVIGHERAAHKRAKSVA